MSRDELYLSVASDLVRFYALMTHSLGFFTEQSGQEQGMSLEQVEAQLSELMSKLLLRLERNPVMRNKIESDFQAVTHLAKEYKQAGSKKGAKKKFRKEAERLQAHARERTSALSDLVAIFRSL